VTNLVMRRLAEIRAPLYVPHYNWDWEQSKGTGQDTSPWENASVDFTCHEPNGSMRNNANN